MGFWRDMSIFPYKIGDHCKIEYDKDGDVRTTKSKLKTYSGNSESSYYSKNYEILGVLKYIFKKSDKRTKGSNND